MMRLVRTLSLLGLALVLLMPQPGRAQTTPGAPAPAAAAVNTAASHLVRESVIWGPGPRAAQALMMTVRAQCLLEGRLVPNADDVARMAVPVLVHRMQLSFAARARGEGLAPLIERIARQVTRVEAAA